MTEQNTRKNVMVKGIDKDLWQQVRVAALKQKKTIPEYVTEALRAKLRIPEKN